MDVLAAGKRQGKVQIHHNYITSWSSWWFHCWILLDDKGRHSELPRERSACCWWIRLSDRRSNNSVNESWGWKKRSWKRRRVYRHTLQWQGWFWCFLTLCPSELVCQSFLSPLGYHKLKESSFKEFKGSIRQKDIWKTLPIKPNLFGSSTLGAVHYMRISFFSSVTDVTLACIDWIKSFLLADGSFLYQISQKINMQSAAVMQIRSGVFAAGRVSSSVCVCSTFVLSLCFFWWTWSESFQLNMLTIAMLYHGDVWQVYRLPCSPSYNARKWLQVNRNC